MSSDETPATTQKIPAPETNPGRSVAHYETEDGLRKALLVEDVNGEKMDWVLKAYDPNTTKVQSMKGELHRLQVLKSYFSLDQEPEPTFDRMTSMAARLFGVQTALISLVDLGRQWFLSAHGYDVKETPRTYSICAHVIQSNGNELIVPDLTADFRFRENPLVTSSPNFQFYAGAALVSPEGYKVCSILRLFPTFNVVNPDTLRSFNLSSELFVF